MWAVGDVIQMQALLRELSLHLAMKRIDIPRPEQATSNTRLVACHECLYPVSFQQREELQGSGHPVNVRRLDGKVTITYQHAVTVKNDG